MSDAWQRPHHLDVTHCTRGRLAHRPRRGRGAAILVALLVVFTPGLARADGDPASDVLSSQALFVPQDAGLSATQQAQLAALVAAARRDGYDLRVAVIASASDLGSITVLWRQPANYARFLGQEIALVAHGPLLIVMPDGYGYTATPGARLAPSALDGLTAAGPALGAGAIGAVRRLAAAAGHPLPLVAVGASTSGHGSGGAALAWSVFGLGWLVILAAWGLSLRARPLRRRAVAPG
jgi:hypothetical protein